MVSYSPSIVTVAVSVAVSEIFSVKEWRDLETRVRGRPRSLEMVPFDRLYTSSCCCGFFENYNFTRGQWVQKGLKLSNSHYCRCFLFSLESFISFLPPDAMQARSIVSCGVCMFVCLFVCLSVCLSVRLSRSWITSKRINISSHFFHRAVAQSFYFFSTKRDGDIPAGTP